MGYRCPVCGDPQADAIHLANHLAFTALVRGGDHEDWLDEHVPGWGELDDEALAGVVTDHAEEADFPQVFEDTRPVREHHHGDPRGSVPTAELPGEGELSAEAAEAIERARELMREGRAEGADERGGE